MLLELECLFADSHQGEMRVNVSRAAHSHRTVRLCPNYINFVCARACAGCTERKKETPTWTTDGGVTNQAGREIYGCGHTRLAAGEARAAAAAAAPKKQATF